jgi:hypothetical protein
MQTKCLIARLEALELPVEEFRHRQHLESAFFYLRRDGREEGQRAMLQTLAAFAAHHGQTEKFHVTLSVCWIRLVACAIADDPDCPTAADLILRHPALLDKKLPLRFYSSQLLFSDPARKRSFDPDLHPFPSADLQRLRQQNGDRYGRSI